MAQFGVGSFGRGPNIYDQSQSEFDVEARRSLDGLGHSKSQLSAEQVKQAYELALRAHETRTIKSQSADQFLLLNPHILDTKKNAELITKMLNNMFGDCAYTVEHYEAATNALLVTDSLDIDKVEVTKQKQKAADAQRKAALKNRADAASRVFNPNTDYENLSVEELRNRANEELQLAGGGAGAAGF